MSVGACRNGDPMDEGIVPQPLDLAIAGVRFGHRLGAQLDQDLAGLGLTWAQLRVLLALAQDGGLVHAGGIGRRMDISRQAAHRLLQRLDGRGFLAWRDDGWIRSARLTHEGYRALNDALASIDRRSGRSLGWTRTNGAPWPGSCVTPGWSCTARPNRPRRPGGWSSAAAAGRNRVASSRANPSTR